MRLRSYWQDFFGFFRCPCCFILETRDLYMVPLLEFQRFTTRARFEMILIRRVLGATTNLAVSTLDASDELEATMEESFISNQFNRQIVNDSEKGLRKASFQDVSHSTSSRFCFHFCPEILWDNPFVGSDLAGATHPQPSQAPPVAPCPLRAAWLRVAARTVAAVAGLRTAKALEAARSMACDAECCRCRTLSQRCGRTQRCCWSLVCDWFIQFNYMQ